MILSFVSDFDAILPMNKHNKLSYLKGHGDIKSVTILLCYPSK